MAAFCTKCGAPLTEGMAFCTKCGAPAAVTGAAAAPPAPPASYMPGNATGASAYAPASTYAATPAQTGGSSSAVKIILIIVAVFVGLGILSFAGFSYFVYRASRIVRLNHNGTAVELTTPGGTFSAGDTPVSASDVGVDLYPGANQQKGAVRISTPKGSTVTAVFETSDSLEKVLSYYRDKLGSGVSFYQSENSAVLTLADEEKKTSVMVTISSDKSDGKTKIAIMHSEGS